MVALTRADVQTYLSGSIKNNNYSDQSHNQPKYEVRFPRHAATLSHPPSTNHDKNNTTKLETSNKININKPEVTSNRTLAFSILHVEVKFRLNF